MNLGQVRHNASVTSIRPKYILRELATAGVVVLVAVILGYGLGIVMNRMFGTTKPSDSPRRTPVAQTTTAPPTKTTTAAATKTTAAPAASTAAKPSSTASEPATSTPAIPGRSTLDLGGGTALKVTSATRVGATKPAGQAVGAGRLTVLVTVENSGSAVVEAPVDRLFIRYAGISVRPDPNATDAAGDLLKPIAPGEDASGELRFETRGAVTAAMKDLSSVALRFGPQRLDVKLG